MQPPLEHLGDIPAARVWLSMRQSKPRRKFGSAKGLIHIADDFDISLPDFYSITAQHLH